MPPFVTYTLLAGCLALLLFAFWLEGKGRAGTRFERHQRFAWVLQIAALVFAYFVLRPGVGRNDVSAELVAARAARTPVFLDFYSNY